MPLFTYSQLSSSAAENKQQVTSYFTLSEVQITW